MATSPAAAPLRAGFRRALPRGAAPARGAPGRAGAADDRRAHAGARRAQGADGTLSRTAPPGRAHARDGGLAQRRRPALPGPEPGPVRPPPRFAVGQGSLCVELRRGRFRPLLHAGKLAVHLVRPVVQRQPGAHGPGHRPAHADHRIHGRPGLLSFRRARHPRRDSRRRQDPPAHSRRPPRPRAGRGRRARRYAAGRDLAAWLRARFL